MQASTLWVGAPSDPGGDVRGGAAYVFHNRGAGWNSGTKLIPSDPSRNGFFGGSIDLDGSRAIIGAGTARGLVDNSGAAYVVATADGMNWGQTAKLVTSDAHGAQRMGGSVTLESETVISGASWDSHGTTLAGAIYVFDVDSALGTPFCSGDGFGAACPCGNSSDIGMQAGCSNGSSRGAVLEASGSASVVDDDLELHAGNLPSSQPALLFSGNNQLGGGNGLPFGDGLRCVGGSVTRLGIASANNSGVASWGPGLGQVGAWAVGEELGFQVWVRDPHGSACGAFFNLTNGYALTFRP